MTSLLAEAHPPDALYAASSLLTMGAFQALRGSGRRVPDDIAFVGTGFIEWAHLTDPPLTLLEVPALEIGRRAVELVLDRVGSPGLPGRSVLIEPTLHIRESCGANPALAPSIKAGSGNAN